MEVPRIDFFILGAPKCGTSALYEYLRGHPGTFVSEVKEPHFYSPDMYDRSDVLGRRVATREDYQALFSAAGPEQLRGEGSTWYLFSAYAVERILADHPDARFIVMLRHPVAMAHSLYNHNHRKLYEDAPEFERAWRLQKERAEGKAIPRHCPDVKMLQYGRAASYGWQLEQLFRRVDRDRVLVHIHEEFFSDIRASWLHTLEFLGLTDDGRMDFERVNENRRLRSRRLYEFLTYPPEPVRRLWRPAKRIANVLGWYPGRALLRQNQEKVSRNPLRPEFRVELLEHFSGEVSEVERWLGRSIPAWRGASE